MSEVKQAYATRTNVDRKWETSKVYPIAEVFTSPQGEGLWAGVLMTFIRTAGCSVGKPFPKERYQGVTVCNTCGGSEKDHRDGYNGRGFKERQCYGYVTQALPIYTEMCTTYDGRTFECDTDYRVKERLSIDQILERIPDGIKHVCISGGEPMIHNLIPLIGTINNKGIMVHLETSGTVSVEKAFGEMSWGDTFIWNTTWVTVSPKIGALPEMIARADEVKLLVDENFDDGKLPEGVIGHRLVYIQPINFENTINVDNMSRVLDVQKIHPDWRISSQSHKLWNVR